jgi:hypothetical protein
MRAARYWLVPFVAALALAVVTRIVFAFDGLYGQDAFAYFGYARALGAHLFRGAPLPPLYWPIGYPVTVALLLPLSGGGPLAGQIVSALACAWAAAATALLVRAFEGPGALGRPGSSAMIAGLIVATSGAVLRSSQLVMADALGLGATAAALVCAVRARETKHAPWLLGCATTWAWGTSARWMIGALPIALLAFVVLDARSRPRDEAPRSPRLWAWAIAASLAAIAILGPVLAVARSSPHSLAKHEWLVAWNPQNAFGRDFHTPEGHALYRLPVLLFYFVRLAWPDYFFPLLAFFAAVGAWVVVRTRRWAWAALLIGWPAAVLLLLSGIPYENPRFLLPTLPAIGALFGIGWGAIQSRLAPRARSATALAVAGASVAGLLLGAREHARLVRGKKADLDLVHWAAARLPPHPNLLMEGPTGAFAYYAAMTAEPLFSATASDVDALLSAGPPLFVLANVADLEGPWKGVGPELRFDALRRSPGLTVLDTHPPFTLFRVATSE